MVERQVKAPVAQLGQDRQACGDFFGRSVAQWRNFEHHLVGLHEFEVATGKAFMRAVHEDELFAHQLFSASVRKGGEDQDHVGGGRVCGAAARAVEQLIADHHLLRIHDGLPRDHGDRGLVAGGRCGGSAGGSG